MMKIKISHLIMRGIISAFAFMIVSFPLRAQNSAGDTTSLYMIKMKDGSTLYGRIIERGTSEIQFETKDNIKMTIPVEKIKEMKPISASSFKNGNYWFPNPNDTRLLLGPTARMLKHGEGYFQDIYIFFANVNYGVTDNITLGGGMSLFPFTGGFGEQVFFFMPKVGIGLSDKFKIAGGGVVAYAFGESFGWIYGAGTYGTSDMNVTGGVGWGYWSEGISRYPTFSVGGMARLTKGFALVSENYFIPTRVYNYYPIMSTSYRMEPYTAFGIRFFGEKISADIAFFRPGSDEFFIGVIPYVDFVVKF